MNNTIFSGVIFLIIPSAYGMVAANAMRNMRPLMRMNQQVRQTATNSTGNQAEDFQERISRLNAELDSLKTNRRNLVAMGYMCSALVGSGFGMGTVDLFMAGHPTTMTLVGSVLMGTGIGGAIRASNRKAEITDAIKVANLKRNDEWINFIQDSK